MADHSDTQDLFHRCTDAALVLAEAQHGHRWPQTSLQTWALALAEEAGEVTKAVLDYHNGDQWPRPYSQGSRPNRRDGLQGLGEGPGNARSPRDHEQSKMTPDDHPQTGVVHVHNELPGPKRRRARVGHHWPNDLAFWRRASGFATQADAAREMGLTRSEYSLVEIGNLMPTREEADRIAAVLKRRIARRLTNLFTGKETA